MSCQCYQIGGPFIAEDPDCEIHGSGGLLERLEEKEERLADLERRIVEMERRALDNR